MNKADDKFRKEFAERLRKRRISLGLSQLDLSMKTDVSPQTISKSEKALSGFSNDILVKISEGLEISTDYLLTGKIIDTDFARLDKELLAMDSETFFYFEQFMKLFISMYKNKNKNDK